jgi:hypothetical protein
MERRTQRCAKAWLVLLKAAELDAPCRAVNGRVKPGHDGLFVCRAIVIAGPRYSFGRLSAAT